MANVYFEPGDQRALKVKALFARIASHYDRLNDLQSFGLHRYWKRRVLRLAQPCPGLRALDLCCGTGDLALGLARSGAETVGLDFSEQMLEVALAKSDIWYGKCPSPAPSAAIECQKTEQSDRRLPSKVGTTKPPVRALRFIQGDAQQVPFPDNSFDIVTVGYGLRNLTSWETGLREMQRVAKPGGRLLVLDFGKPDNPLWRGLFFGYLRLVVPILGRIWCGDAQAYSYILESLHHYPAQHGVAAKMRELGLTKVRLCQLLGGIMSINYAEKAPDLR
jgi:demethylmenaquinone methyltransferase / 2-methoxy-6-polyprenyl-1,4-benzoquinol methylase